MSRRAIVQAFKGALAAVSAWVLADDVLGLPQPFLAPYAAVLMIESTVYRSIRGSLQQLAAASTAVLLAFLASRLVPDPVGALGVAVLIGLLIGRWSPFGDSGRWIGVTVVLVLTVSGATHEVLLVDRLVETALGAAIGTVVNAVVLPPSYARWASAATADLAAELRAVLGELANALRAPDLPQDSQAWVRRTKESERLVRRAEEAVGWNNESGRMNVLRRREHRDHDRVAVNLREVWPRLVQIAEAVHSCIDSGRVFHYPSPESRAEYAALLDDLAEVVKHGEERDVAFHEAIADTRRRIARLDERLTTTDLAGSSGAARGLSGMLLPARLALDALAR